MYLAAVGAWFAGNIAKDMYENTQASTPEQKQAIKDAIRNSPGFQNAMNIANGNPDAAMMMIGHRTLTKDNFEKRLGVPFPY